MSNNYNYFPCELPCKLSEVAYIQNDNAAEALIKTADKLRNRMNLLNRALDISRIQPERFAAAAKVLFDTASAVSFDQMTADELASSVSVVAALDKNRYEPRKEWPNAVAVFDCRFVSNEDWETMRHIGLGGSDAASILDCSPYKTCVDTYLDKTGQVLGKKDPGKQVIFDRGHMMEPLVIDAFCRTFGAKQIPEYRMFRSAKYPHATANIDAIAEMPGGKIVVFEAKTTIEENWAAWASGSVPIQYIPQTRQYPAVLNDPRIAGTYIGCLFTKDYSLNDRYCGSTYDGEQFKAVFIPRDEMEEDCQLQQIEDFWNDYIQAGVEPPASPESARNLESFYSTIGKADKSAPVVDFPVSEWGEKAQDILELGEKIKVIQGQADALKEQKKAKELEFIKKLGTAVEGCILLSNGEQYVEVKNSPRSRETVDSKELKVLIDALAGYGVPESFVENMKECFKKNEESTRVFSMKIKKNKKNKK